MRLLVYQHVPHETPGDFLEAAQDSDVQVDTIRLWEHSKLPFPLKKYDRLLIMGGPQSVYAPPREYSSKRRVMYAIEHFKNLGKPVLGICLGSQLLLYSHWRQSVYPNIVNGKHVKETGFYQVQLTELGRRDLLFKEFPDSFEVFQWHGDVFDLPVYARLLVRSQNVSNQAFGIGRNYGILFHIEITPQMIEQLIRTDREWLHKDNEVDEDSLIQQAYEKEKPLRALGRRLFENWLTI